MNDPFFVRGPETVGDLFCDRHRLVDGNRSTLQELGKIFAVDELEHQRHDTVRLFEAMDRCDVRIMERCQELRFAAESSEPRRVRGERAGQHLDRDVTVELRIPRAVDLAHSTLAERSELSRRGRGGNPPSESSRPCLESLPRLRAAICQKSADKRTETRARGEWHRGVRGV